ncbi:hypothetical protein HDK90DRAFT_475549 [Phyllosticta capitalensis]|uniref:Secreted protein n=1 Tax=Phyllosticta capitalensis TaxID=121624 RepID=A0ABR1YYH1_9PEZI
MIDAGSFLIFFFFPSIRHFSAFAVARAKCTSNQRTTAWTSKASRTRTMIVWLRILVASCRTASTPGAGTGCAQQSGRSG